MKPVRPMLHCCLVLVAQDSKLSEGMSVLI